MALPAEYLAVLEQLALAFASYRESAGHDAVLVGGAATAIYTAGAFPSADFDVVARADEAFEAAMCKHGFVRENRPRYLLVGFHHPGHPGFGVQQVTPPLFEGRADTARVQWLAVSADAGISPPAIEDMIADRLAQHAVASPTDTSRLEQARALFGLARGLDHDCLTRRIADEGGDPSVLGLG